MARGVRRCSGEAVVILAIESMEVPLLDEHSISLYLQRLLG
jgi:hypothetical protein